MEITRAAVAAPPLRDFYFTPGRASALGAQAVKRELEKSNIETAFFNFPLLNARGKQISSGSRYDYLKPYILPYEKGPLSFFTGRKLFGPPFEEAARLLLDSQPQVIFLSLFAWTYGDDAIALAEEVRKLSSIPIIVGGAGAAVFPEFFERTGLFEAVVRGDAEDVIPPVLDLLASGSKKFASLPSEVSDNPPEPAVSFRKDSKGNQFLTLSLSKGCPKKCRFCSNFLTQGRIFRPASLSILKERLLTLPIDRNRNVHINLEDDNLLVRKTYFNDFLKIASELYPRRSFSMHNGLDYTYLTEKYADHLIGKGFNHFSLSLGSADAAVLQAEKRPADLNKLESLLNHLQNRGIASTTFFICGLPDDTREGIIKSLLYLHGLPTEVGISLFYPVPGLPIFEDRDPFLSEPTSLCSGSSAYPWANSLKTSEMVTAFRLARFSNLLKKDLSDPKEQNLVSKIISSRKLHTFSGRKKEIIEIPHLDDSMVSRFLKEINN